MNTDRLPHITEQELLNRFYADRNKEWLGILLQRHTLLLLGVCMKYLKNEEAARDAVQQIFLKAITELEKYRVDYFKSWLYMIAKNHCLMQFRDKNKAPVELNEQVLHQEADDVLQSLREKDQLLDWMHDSLKSLSPEQQQCVTLFYLEKKSYQQIAEETGYSLLQKSGNEMIGNKSFREKRVAFQASPLAMTSMVGEYGQWTETEIEDRQARLAEIAIKTWPV